MIGFISIIIILVASIIALLVEQHAIKENIVYTGHILQSRYQFLSDVFGFQADELKQLHFDGYSFHFADNLSYKDFNLIECISVQHVTVYNNSVPHMITWRHTRVDGGPDLRYSDNPSKMTSRQFILKFNAKNRPKPIKLVTYEYPSSQFSGTEETIKKFNMLFTALLIKYSF